MPFELGTASRAEGYRLQAHDRIASTNAAGLALAAAGERGPLWIVTDDQFAGRGRRSRSWSTPKGNLAASLLVAPEGDLEHLATLGFVASTALSSALEAVAPDTAAAIGVDGAGGPGGPRRVELKWPNDVLLDGGKLAGILLESVRRRDGRSAIVIGFGVNVIAHPADTPYPSTSLRARGVDISAVDMFAALSDAWVDAFDVWRGAGGLEAIRRRWLSRAAGLGAPVAVQADGQVVRGMLETIDEACRLVIRQADGRFHHVAAGDVHFGAVAGVPQQGQRSGI